MLPKHQYTATIFALLTTLSQAASIQSITTSQWSALNQSVDGRLFPGIPTAAACYRKFNGKANPHVDLVKCATLQVNSQDDLYLSSQFGSYQNYNWGTCLSKAQGCPLDVSTTLPVDPISPLTGNCQQGAISNMYIEVASVSDIQHGLAFAAKNDVPLVIKNSGHDYKGRSAAPNSLALWTHKLAPTMKFEKAFVPAGCDTPVGNVITYGAGQNFQGMNNFAALHDSVVVSATAFGVGPAGGWLAGGGHAPLSPAFGLGVDNVYQMRAVLPNGTYITASRCQNPDLFWAMRGGGGGTFAVVTEASQIAHPATKYNFAQFIFAELNPAQTKRFLAICIENAEKWASQGWGGYAFPGGFGNRTSLFFMVNPTLSLADAQKAMKPMRDFARTLRKGNVGVHAVTQYPTYDVPYSVMAGATERSNGVSNALASRIVPVGNFRGRANQTKLLNAMYPIANAFSAEQRQPLFICMTTPWGYTPSSLVADSSVTPAWRDGLWHVIGVNTYSNSADASETTQAFRTAHDALGPLRDLTPDGGAYQNEADTFEDDPIGAYWGEENYAKLLKIKNEVDPANMLTCHQCVGWDKDDSRFGCYPSGV